MITIIPVRHSEPTYQQNLHINRTYISSTFQLNVSSAGHLEFTFQVPSTCKLNFLSAGHLAFLCQVPGTYSLNFEMPGFQNLSFKCPATRHKVTLFKNICHQKDNFINFIVICFMRILFNSKVIALLVTPYLIHQQIFDHFLPPLAQRLNQI